MQIFSKQLDFGVIFNFQDFQKIPFHPYTESLWASRNAPRTPPWRRLDFASICGPVLMFCSWHFMSFSVPVSSVSLFCSWPHHRTTEQKTHRRDRCSLTWTWPELQTTEADSLVSQRVWRLRSASTMTFGIDFGIDF